MRLFWKLFLALLLSLLGIAAVSSWFSQRWLLESQHTEQRLAQLSGYAQTAASLYVEEGSQALHRWLHQSMRQDHFRGFLLDAQGSNLLERRPLRPELEEIIRQAIEKGSPLRLVHPPFLLTVTPIDIAGQRFFWVANSLIDPDTMHQNLQHTLVLRLLLALILILFVSSLLSRMFTRPIRQLQQTAAQLGSGRMETRAPQPLAKRGDELGELARSFDSMAMQLEGLMASHKQLLRDVSHELRSPLARLSVALELARDAAGGKAEEELSRIGLETERLNALIGEVLTLARFEQGAIQARMAELDLAVLLREVVADAAFEAEAAGKRVRMQGPEACGMQGDPLWLGRALDNVLRNAVRHTASGSTVEIDLQCDERHARITIRDHGPGVPDEALPHLFEPFFRAEEARSRISGGYGLGLAIARQVVELHGGRIGAAHAPESGLIIEISLPIS